MYVQYIQYYLVWWYDTIVVHHVCVWYVCMMHVCPVHLVYIYGW